MSFTVRENTMGTDRYRWLLVVVVGLGIHLGVACGKSNSKTEAVPTTDGGVVSGGGDASTATVIDTGPQYVDACTAFNSQCQGSTEPNCGKCQYRIRYNDQNCSKAKPCDNLFMYFAFAGCEGDRIQAVLDSVVSSNDDVATACVQPLYPGEVLPISLGAPERENVLLPQVMQLLQSPSQMGIWSGKNLLFGGCSHGATRYPVVAARYPDDAAWVGSEKTAACLSDGVLSLTVQDRFIGEKISAGMTCAGRHSRIVNAYTRSMPQQGHACSGSPNQQCACDSAHAFRVYSDDCNGGDCVSFDSILQENMAQTGFVLGAGVTASDFAVTHWKLMSEGGNWANTDTRCENDVVPAGPFQALCQAIEADPSRSCTYVNKPEAKHCEYYLANVNSICVDWFKGL